MSVARARREASKRLGLALMKDYRALVEASGPEEIQNAAIELGVTFRDNIEFVCWVLKEYGGLQQMPIERLPHASKMATSRQ